MNNFTCTTRLGNDSEVRHTNSGTAVCTFSGAIDSGYGDNKKTLWIRFTLWGKRATGRLPEFLVKGCQAAISGELSMNEWTDKEGGKRSTLECNVNNLDLIGGKGQDGGQQSGSGESSSPESKKTGMGEDVPF